MMWPTILRTLPLRRVAATPQAVYPAEISSLAIGEGRGRQMVHMIALSWGPVTIYSYFTHDPVASIRRAQLDLDGTKSEDRAYGLPGAFIYSDSLPIHHREFEAVSHNGLGHAYSGGVLPGLYSVILSAPLSELEYHVDHLYLADLGDLVSSVEIEAAWARVSRE
jgi:hypothetical protein